MNNKYIFSLEDSLKMMNKFRHLVIEYLDGAKKNGSITEREYDIFIFRHIKSSSLEVCGREFGVTRERIRQIEARVFEALRCMYYS
jgi:DNA-directed RNA polymerase sigma subunit (sigma70/sigma32)